MNDRDLEAAGHAVTNLFDGRDPSFEDVSIFMAGWCEALDYIHENATSQNDAKSTKPRGIITQNPQPDPTEP